MRGEAGKTRPLFRKFAAIVAAVATTLAAAGEAPAMTKANAKAVDKLYAKAVEKYEGKTLGRWSSHRGYSDAAPENSEEAFLLAAKCGAFAIEGDLQAAKDGTPYMFHDATLDAKTDATGRLETHTAKQAKKIRINFGAGIGKFRKVKLCTFRKYLQICKKYGRYAVIDLKEVKSPKVRKKLMKKASAELERAGMTNRCKVISFYWSSMKAWQKACPSTPCRLMTRDGEKAADRVAFVKAEASRWNDLPKGMAGYVTADAPVVEKDPKASYRYVLTKRGPKRLGTPRG